MPAPAHRCRGTVHEHAAPRRVRRCDTPLAHILPGTHEGRVREPVFSHQIAATGHASRDTTVPGNTASWGVHRADAPIALVGSLVRPYVLDGSAASHTRERGSRVRITRMRLERKRGRRWAHSRDHSGSSARRYRAIERTSRSPKGVRYRRGGRRRGTKGGRRYRCHLHAFCLGSILVGNL